MAPQRLPPYSFHFPITVLLSWIGLCIHYTFVWNELHFGLHLSPVSPADREPTPQYWRGALPMAPLCVGGISASTAVTTVNPTELPTPIIAVTERQTQESRMNQLPLNSTVSTVSHAILE